MYLNAECYLHLRTNFISSSVLKNLHQLRNPLISNAFLDTAKIMYAKSFHEHQT